MNDMTRLAGFAFDIQGEVARRNAHVPEAARLLERHLTRILAAIADSPGRGPGGPRGGPRGPGGALLKGPVTCRRRGPLRGSFEVPGDKSVSHRSLLFAALAEGETRVRGLLAPRTSTPRGRRWSGWAPGCARRGPRWW